MIYCNGKKNVYDILTILLNVCIPPVIYKSNSENDLKWHMIFYFFLCTLFSKSFISFTLKTMKIIA